MKLALVLLVTSLAVCLTFQPPNFFKERKSLDFMKILKSSEVKLIQGKSFQKLGVPETFSDAPWVAYITFVKQINETHNGTIECNGALYNESFVLTASICVYGAWSASIKLGSNSSGSVTYTSAKFIFHEYFNPDEILKNGIALIKLANRITLQDKRLHGLTYISIPRKALFCLTFASSGFTLETAFYDPNFALSKLSYDQSNIMQGNTDLLSLFSSPYYKLFDNGVFGISTKSFTAAECAGGFGNTIYTNTPSGKFLMGIGLFRVVFKDSCLFLGFWLPNTYEWIDATIAKNYA